MEMKKYTRSVSQLKQVTHCGEAFAISRGFRGPKPPPRPWAQTVAGSAFHSMIVEWEKSGRTKDPIDLFNSFWEIELEEDRKSTRLNSSHVKISYAVFCLKKKT